MSTPIAHPLLCHLAVPCPLSLQVSASATLAVDGDGTPSSAPFTQLLVQGLDPMTYLSALSPEAANIATQMDDNVRIQ